MKIRLLLLIPSVLLFLSSCIEIIDDVQMNNEGSGSFKYTINLSASKVKITSILALDSLDGKKVPSRTEITDRISAISKKLASKSGISNVSIDPDRKSVV
jgi:hypothetical protein